MVFTRCSRLAETRLVLWAVLAAGMAASPAASAQVVFLPDGRTAYTATVLSADPAGDAIDGSVGLGFSSKVYAFDFEPLFSSTWNNGVPYVSSVELTITFDKAPFPTLVSPRDTSSPPYFSDIGFTLTTNDAESLAFAQSEILRPGDYGDGPVDGEFASSITYSMTGAAVTVGITLPTPLAVHLPRDPFDAAFTDLVFSTDWSLFVTDAVDEYYLLFRMAQLTVVIPEPSTYALLAGLGSLAALVVLRRRRS